MTDSEGWQATHFSLSALDLKFREMAKDSPEYLDRNNFSILDQGHELLHYPLQSWPTFLGSGKLDEIKRVSLGVHTLLRDVPERIFRNDPEKLSEFYGLGSPAVTEVLFLPPTGAETMITRGDLIETPSGFKCIELNFSPNLGGWDTSIITELQLAAPPIARFLEQEGLRAESTDTMHEIFRHIVEDVSAKEIVRHREVTIAFLVNPEEIPDIDRGLEYFNRELRRTLEILDNPLIGRVVSASYERLVPRGDSLYLEGQRLDALVELSGPLTPRLIYRLFKGDLIGLYNGPLNTILSSKRNVALLSQYAASGIYSPEERVFIERHIPWTRLVSPGGIQHEGNEQDAVGFLTAHRERLVLKDADSWGGKGVVLGRVASPEQWRETIDRALAQGDWVVQEVLESVPYLYQNGEYGCSIHDMIWGPFIIGSGYGGVVLRMQPKAVGGPVNLSLYATEGIVFEV